MWLDVFSHNASSRAIHYIRAILNSAIVKFSGQEWVYLRYQKLCINSTWIALLKHEFMLVEKWLFKVLAWILCYKVGIIHVFFSCINACLGHWKGVWGQVFIAINKFTELLYTKSLNCFIQNHWIAICKSLNQYIQNHWITTMYIPNH